MQIRSVGIDLGKTTFHLVALGDNGKVLLKKKFTQKQLIAFTANMQTCLIGMEAHPENAEPGCHAVERVEGPGASDRAEERRSGTDRFERCCVSETAADPWHRTAGCNRDRGLHRQRRSLPQGTRVRGLDGAAAEAAFDRWQGEAVWNQQARQLLPAQDPDSWSTRGRIAIQAGPNRDGCMDDLA